MAAILKNIKRKLARKRNLPEETAEIGVRTDDSSVDEIIDLVDPLQGYSYTPNKANSGEEEPLGAFSEEPSDAEIEQGLETPDEAIDELENTLEAESIEGESGDIIL